MIWQQKFEKRLFRSAGLFMDWKLQTVNGLSLKEIKTNFLEGESPILKVHSCKLEKHW